MRFPPLGAAAVLFAGCAHRPPPSFHSTPLLVQRSEGAVKPYVRATVAGHPLLLVVDTGAGQSFLPAGFVLKHGIPTRSTSANPLLTDVNGAVLSVPRAPGVSVQFDGETTVETIDFLVNDTDDSESVGILAPQDLIRSSRALVIDFEHGELRYEPEKAALERLAGAAGALREIDYRSCEFDNHRVASATINGVPTSLLLDTGASRTTLARNNEAIPSIASLKGKRGTATGMASIGHDLLVGGVLVGFADRSFVVSTLVLPVSARCGRGILGADVLGQCTMVWGARSLWVSCRPGTKIE
jgi:hypothetical protein